MRTSYRSVHHFFGRIVCCKRDRQRDVNRVISYLRIEYVERIQFRNRRFNVMRSRAVIMKTRRNSDELTGEKFDAMSPAERQKIIDELEQLTPEQLRAMSRPPTAAEHRQLLRVANKIGRPKVRKGRGRTRPHR